MTQIVKLVQGSPEWHEHRRNHRNASETPAVLGVSPWTTPFQLWQIKTGRAIKIHVLAIEGSLPAHADGETICTAGKELSIDIIKQPINILHG